jgi:hypothetical protein
LINAINIILPSILVTSSCYNVLGALCLVKGLLPFLRSSLAQRLTMWISMFFFMNRNLIFKKQIQSYYQSNHATTLKHPSMCKPFIQLWSKPGSNSLLQHQFSKYFALAKKIVVMILGCKRHWQLFFHLVINEILVVEPINCTFRFGYEDVYIKTIQFGFFPFGDVIKDWTKNKVRYVVNYLKKFNIHHKFNMWWINDRNCAKFIHS